MEKDTIEQIREAFSASYKKYYNDKKGYKDTKDSKESSKDKSKGGKDPITDGNSNSGNAESTGALNNQVANIDGIPNVTQDYHTLESDTSGSIQRLTQQVTATFSTQIGDFTAAYSIGRENIDTTTNSQYTNFFEGELLAFNTINDKNQDTPTFQLTLLGVRDWEDMLLVNDYVQVGVEQFSKDYPGQSESYTLITGLISDVRKTINPANNMRTYTVVCQGMQKILNNINIATLTELMGYSAYLIYDSSQFGSGFDSNKDSSAGNSGDSGDFGDGVAKGKSKDIVEVAQWALANHSGGQYSLSYHNSSNWDNNDCSGFVSMVCNRAGVKVGLLNTNGFASSSKFKRIKSKSDLAAGDLIEWNNLQHIGIYLGGNKAISFDGPQDPQGIIEHSADYMPFDFGLRVK